MAHAVYSNDAHRISNRTRLDSHQHEFANRFSNQPVYGIQAGEDRSVPKAAIASMTRSCTPDGKRSSSFSAFLSRKTSYMALRFPGRQVLFERSVAHGLQPSSAKPSDIFGILKTLQQFLIDFNWQDDGNGSSVAGDQFRFRKRSFHAGSLTQPCCASEDWTFLQPAGGSIASSPVVMATSLSKPSASFLVHSK